MKPGYLNINSIASKLIAAPLILITTTIYMVRAINLPAQEVFSMAITAFGITAALSGVCFTMDTSKKEETAIRFAGEKFLHSSLLLIQYVIVIYAKDAIISISFIATHNTLKTIIDVTFSILIILISSTAGITWFWGFDMLNNELWRKWKNRINSIRK
jgi:hypothetical protein